jgi:hypothetical protein
MEDARRVMAVLGERLGRYNLKLHPDKTRLMDFRRPTLKQEGGKGPELQRTGLAYEHEDEELTPESSYENNRRLLP